MTRVDEAEVADALAPFEGGGTVDVGELELEVSIDVNDIHAYDSPDCIFTITFEYELFGQTMRVEVPLPVEAEAAGLGAAEEDLEKLIQRRNYVPEFPMLVVAEKGYDRDETTVEQAVNYSIRQIPVRKLKND